MLTPKEEKKRLKAERKAAAIAKQAAKLDGTWVEPLQDVKKVKEDTKEEEEIHLLHVYSAQAGEMFNWIKSGKHSGKTKIFYEKEALDPLIATLRKLKDSNNPESLLEELIAHSKTL